jgi:hypothetical protein
MRGARGRFVVFCLLTIVLLALVPLAQMAFGIPSLDFGEMAERASAATGVPWTSNLVSVVRLAVVEPGLWLLLLGSAIPTIAALTMLAVSSDRSSLKAWLSRLGPGLIRRHVTLRSAGAIASVCLGVLAALWLVFEMRSALGLHYERPINLFSSALPFALLTGMFLDHGALLEEGGWRGYATPLLQDNHVTALHAALLVGLAWGVWHVPRDIVSGVISRQGIGVYTLLYLPAFLAGTIAVSVIAAFCVNRLGGSVLPAIVIHGLTNDAAGIAGTADIAVALAPLHQITKAAPLAILAGLILLIAGPSLGWNDAREPSRENMQPREGHN